MPKLVAVLEYPQGQSAEHRGAGGNESEANCRGDVGKAEEAIAKAVDHIKERIEVRQSLPERRQGVDRVENAREKGQGHDQKILERRQLVELVGHDTGDKPQRAENGAAEQGERQRPQRMLQ